jgi:hypothetical protein
MARPADELRCAEIFLHHLGGEPGWSFLEFVEQDETSPLAKAAASTILAPDRLHVRRFENNPTAVIHLAGVGWDDYLSRLGEHRKKVANRARRLFEAGLVELVSSRDTAATPSLLELYQDLEQRSWKAGTKASIARHPARQEIYLAVTRGDTPLAPEIHLLLLDGLPVAGRITCRFGRGQYWLESTFADGHGDLAPGNVLFLLSVRKALDHGADFINLLGNFEHAKARWNAEIIPTASVQVFRRGSLHHWKSRLGDLRRRLTPAKVTQRTATRNLSKPQAPAAPDRTSGLDEAHRDRCRAVLERLGAGGARLECWGEDTLREVLRIDARGSKATGAAAGITPPGTRPRIPADRPPAGTRRPRSPPSAGGAG